MKTVEDARAVVSLESNRQRTEQALKYLKVNPSFKAISDIGADVILAGLDVSREDLISILKCYVFERLLNRQQKIALEIDELLK